MTYVTDPIGDLLTRIRNAQAARKHSCRAPWSRIKQELCELLVRDGWLEKTEVIDTDGKKDIEVTFIPGKKLTLTRQSKPGRRYYARYADLKPVLRGYGIAVLTTSKGLMTDGEARKQKLGGEVLCTIA